MNPKVIPKNSLEKPFFENAGEEGCTWERFGGEGDWELGIGKKSLW